MQKLNSAINKKEIVEIEYWNSDNRKYSQYIIKPLYIFFDKYCYYLLAWKDDNKNKPGVYAINRMKKVHSTETYFEIPFDFKISDYIKEVTDANSGDNKIYLFELSFHKNAASEAMEKTYYHNQIIKKCEDGTVFVSFRSTQLHEVFHWVLGQGYKVKVLNPPELVTMIKNEVLKVRQYYM